MSKRSKNKPIAKGLYAWNFLHAGSFLLYVESLKHCHHFIFLPGPSDYYLTIEDFEKCIASNTLEFVESLPNDIFQESLRLSCPNKKNRVTFNEKK